MKKLLRRNKVFGRCTCHGHGDRCEVTRDIQSVAITRSKEKRETFKEINGEMAEWVKALPC